MPDPEHPIDNSDPQIREGRNSVVGDADQVTLNEDLGSEFASDSIKPLEMLDAPWKLASSGATTDEEHLRISTEKAVAGEDDAALDEIFAEDDHESEGGGGSGGGAGGGGGGGGSGGEW